MKAKTRNLAIKAYNNAVYSELQNKGQSPEQALRTIKRYSRPLRQTWGFELNPEALADEMIKLQNILTQPKGNTVTIKPHFRTNMDGKVRYVHGHKRTPNLFSGSKARLKHDASTGKVNIVRDQA